MLRASAARQATPATSWARAPTLPCRALLSVPYPTQPTPLLVQMFREQVLKLRDVVNRVTGYKIDMQLAKKAGAPTIVKIHSIFAEQEDDVLIFHLTADASLHLVSSPFAQRMDSKLTAYLKLNNAIPAFTSAVTLQLFENSTMAF